MRGTVWIGCALALSGLVGTLLHAQISEADKKKRDAFLKAREEIHTIASPTPSDSPKPGANQKSRRKKRRRKRPRRTRTKRRLRAPGRRRVLLRRRSPKRSGERKRKRRNRRGDADGSADFDARRGIQTTARCFHRVPRQAGVQRAPGRYHHSEIRNRKKNRVTSRHRRHQRVGVFGRSYLAEANRAPITAS